LLQFILVKLLHSRQLYLGNCRLVIEFADWKNVLKVNEFVSFRLTVFLFTFINF